MCVVAFFVFFKQGKTLTGCLALVYMVYIQQTHFPCGKTMELDVGKEGFLFLSTFLYICGLHLFEFFLGGGSLPQ